MALLSIIIQPWLLQRQAAAQVCTCLADFIIENQYFNEFVLGFCYVYEEIIVFEVCPVKKIITDYVSGTRLYA